MSGRFWKASAAFGAGLVLALTALAGHAGAVAATPTITKVSPAYDKIAGGSVVTVTGTNFALGAGTTIKFGTTSAPNTVCISATTCYVVSPTAAAASQVDITATVSGVTSATGAADKFTYYDVPTVTAVSPTSGPVAGGSTVTITGTNFATAAGLTTVKFGSVASTTVTCASSTSCSAKAPAQASGKVDVLVTVDGQASTAGSGDKFDYLPAITKISPAMGPLAGGTSVTVTGTGFSTTGGATTFKFGTTAAMGSCSSATSCTVTSPAIGGITTGTAKDITATVNSETTATSAADQFTFQGAPTVTSLSATSGPVAGGGTVTITGTNFLTATGATTVKFGSSAGTSVTCASTTSCSAKAPAASAGKVDVTVTAAGQTSATGSGDKFDYLPAITKVAPAIGPVAGGTTVTVTGTGFSTSATTFKFGTASGTSVHCASATSCTVVSPAVSASQVDITATVNSETTATGAADQFTFQGVPTVTAISPTSGPAAGGTAVTITGTNFLTAAGATTVKFGSTAAKTVTCASTTSCSATAPAGTVGQVDVTVAVVGQTSTTSAADKFTYLPTISKVSPATGTTAGGTAVTITGTGFSTAAGGTTIKFGSAAATNVVCTSSTTCYATSPAVSAGQVDVTATVNSAVSATSSADKFTYQ